MVVVPLLIALGIHGPPPARPELTLERRIEAQATVARVYQSHREGAPAGVELPRSVLEAQVLDYLRLSAALDRFWHTPITATMLARETRRIESQTRMPERLAEIRHALGDDPVLFQECVVRPALVRRLAHSFFARDERIHAVARAEWEDWWTRQASLYDPTSVAVAALPNASGATAAGTCNFDPVWTWDTGGALSLFPDARAYEVTVWTGSEMLIWGGTTDTKGEAYDPAIDSWRSLSTQGAPQARKGASGVWTGTELLVWGGITTTVFPSVALGTGARYAPATDTWQPLPDDGAPSARSGHTAVWTGTEMIVWGGTPKFGDPVIGARYNRQTNAWSPMPSSAHDDRSGHTAVWTGTTMIVWGGYIAGAETDTGDLFDPIANSWTPLPTSGAPAPRIEHTAIWTGNAMVVWGGSNGGSNQSSGGVFRPSSGWAPVSTVNAPSARRNHTAVWTGSEMLVWGGSSLGNGGSYRPDIDTWSALPINPTNAPQARSGHGAVWTGSRMIVHSGNDLAGQPLVGGGRYDPVSDSWTPTARTPDERSRHTAVWTGSEMIVWGGVRRSNLPATNGGAMYDPALDAWQPTSLTGAPAARSEHTAVWTGNRMVIWGGLLANNQRTNTGGRYDPALDAWMDTSAAGAPSDRNEHVAVWTGNEMLVWGGTDAPAAADCLAEYAQGGGRYNPVQDVWTPMTLVNEPYMRKSFDGVWTGTELVIWGGETHLLASPCVYAWHNGGGRYDPVLDRWRTTTITGAPTARYDHRMVWTGQQVLVWGGNASDPGARYDPVADTWAPMTATGQPQRPRRLFTALWMQGRMVVWGGRTGIISDNPYLNGNSGGWYDPAADTWTATTFSGVPAPRWSHTAIVADGSTMIVWGGEDFAYPTPKGDGSAYSLVSPQYPDSDGDGLFDCEDACPLDPGNDADLDGLCASADNCPTVHNAQQRDDDVDGVGNLCDVCLSNADTSQADSDGDGEGDACDCNPQNANVRSPAEVAGTNVSRVSGGARITWNAAAGADTYLVSRGTLGSLQSPGYGACLADQLHVRRLDDAEVPPAGVGWFYLIQGQSSECGLGAPGFDTLERQRSDPSACSALLH